MKLYRKSLLFFFALVLSLPLVSCRSKAKPKTSPVPPPRTTVTTPTPPPIDVRVPPPADFVDDSNQVATENLDDMEGSIEEVNRTAATRGYIRDAFFQYDAFALSADAQEALAVSSSWLKAHPKYNLLIEGHCDERGTEQYNLALGDRRAHTAKEYMVTLGIEPDRIRSVSYGEERPFSTGASDEAFAQNRRAHLVLTER